jgi:hypothetical protein
MACLFEVPQKIPWREQLHPSPANVRKSELKILRSVNSHNFVGPTDPPQGMEGQEDGRKSVQKASASAAATEKE